MKSKSKSANSRLISNLIKNIKNTDHWELSNSVLYDLCKKHPDHEELKVVIAKTLIIGRVYSATLERGKATVNDSGDLFYTKHVYPAFKKLFSAEKVKQLITRIKANKADVDELLMMHGLMVKAMYSLRKMNKVSFSSKYLHFHYPKCYFIIDSRAKYALTLLNSYLTLKGFSATQELEFFSTENKNVNYDYEKFYRKCVQVKRSLEIITNRKWTTREFDTLLINIANKIPRKIS